MKDLDIVYCKNCKYFNKKEINKDSILYFCNRKGNHSLELETPELYCNKNCFEQKLKQNKLNKDAKTAKKKK